MGEILSLLRSTWSLLFSSVAGGERVRAEWVVTLLALLEMVRLGQARARQSELFGDIVIERGGGVPVDVTDETDPAPMPGRARMTEPIDVLEALLFASESPVETTTIREVLELPSADAARTLVEALTARAARRGPRAPDPRGGRRLPAGDAARRWRRGW